MWDPETQMSCDINVNNHVALTNTQLVKAYMSIGKPIVSRGLAMLVKYWTQRRLLNEGRRILILILLFVPCVNSRQLPVELSARTPGHYWSSTFCKPWEYFL